MILVPIVTSILIMEYSICETNDTKCELKSKDEANVFVYWEPIERKNEERKMKGFLRSGKNLVFLFVCGFFVGIFLEVLIIERQKLGFLPQKDHLTASVKVTCLVLQKHPHKRYIQTSKETWIRRCDEYFIVKIVKPQTFKKKAQDDTTLEVDGLQKLLKNNKTCLMEEGKFKNGGVVTGSSGWSGLCKALQLTKDGLKEWIIIVPDSLVVIVENLKLFVKNLNPDDDHYYGYALENYNGDFNTLSAGILLSRGAVFKLFEKFKNEKDCDSSGKYWRNEDIYLGKYLKEMGILPKDTRDNKGRGKFHGYNLKNLIWPGKLFLQSEYTKKALYPVPKGFNCCSPFLITMGISDADAMKNLYFFLYKINTIHQKPSNKIEPSAEKKFFWKDFLREEGYREDSIENMTDEEYFKIWEKKFPLDTIYKETKKLLENRDTVLN